MEIVVDPDKIFKYLLLDEDKSRFFRLVGYSEVNGDNFNPTLYPSPEIILSG